MILSEKLREMLQEWRDKAYDHLGHSHELQRKEGCHECADDLEEFLNCNPKIDELEI